jgi:hypothetical protein
VKRVIEKLGPSDLMEDIIRMLAEHVIEVAQSSFGNYAIQHVLEVWFHLEMEADEMQADF